MSVEGEKLTKEARLQSLLSFARSNGEECTVGGAAAHFGVSRRTIARDVVELKMVGVDIELCDDRIVCRGGDYQIEASETAMRRIAILSLLSGGAKSLSSIVDALREPGRDFDVDERTVRRDLEYLAAHGYIDEPDANASGYRLTNVFMPRFSLPYSQLSAVMRALDACPAALADRAVAESIKSKIMAALVPDPSEMGVVSKRRYIVGRAHRSSRAVLSRVEMLELAAYEQQVVQMSYQGFTSGEGAKCRFVEPLGVIYYWFHDMWYLIAHCRKAGGIRHFRLDRIHSLAVTDQRFEYPSGFDLEEYAKDMWGVYRGEPTGVRVDFYDELNVIARLKAETAHRPHARLEQIEKGVWEYTDTVLGLTEFKAWLRSFGSSAVVLEPECLRSEVIQSALRMRAIYAREGQADEIK